MLLWRFWKVVFVCYINWVIQICRTNLCENCVINFASCYINLEFLAEPIWNWCIWSALTTWFVIEEYKHESNMHQSLCRSLVCPRGIRDLLLYFEKEYTIPSIYITESGNNTSQYSLYTYCVWIAIEDLQTYVSTITLSLQLLPQKLVKTISIMFAKYS